MIDWNQIDEESGVDWVKLTNLLIVEAQAAVQSLDGGKMQAAADDILDYMGHHSFYKPDWAAKAMVRSQSQLTAARQGLELGILTQGSDKLDAILARMSSAGNELKAEAAKLSLEPVKDALQLALDVSAEVKSIEADVKKLPKDDIADRLSRVLKVIEKLRGKLGDALA